MQEATKTEFGFLSDLDDYFCENYANYDKLCVLDGYRMPKMQATERRGDGRLYSYTLPANTMRLAKQENREKLLEDLKSKIKDKNFSFSFEPAGFFTRLLKNKKYSFKSVLGDVLRKSSLTAEELGKGLSIEQKVWNKICSGDYLPAKNLIFSIALAARTTYEDACDLLAACGMEFDYTLEREVVISYLLKQKIFNKDMMQAAFVEYAVSNLFIVGFES